MRLEKSVPQILILLLVALNLSAQSVNFERSYDQTAKYGTGENAYYLVSLGQKIGICNKNGKEIIPPGNYVSANQLLDTKSGCGLYVLLQNTTSGRLPVVFDLNGKYIMGPDPSVTSVAINKGIIVWNQFKLAGLYNFEGKVVIPHEFADLSYDEVSNTMCYMPFEGGNYVSTGIAPDGTMVSGEDTLKTINYLKNYYSTPHNRALQLYREGVYYQTGQDRPRDFQKACEFFEAAGKYDNYFMSGIAQMSELGLGREQNLAFAHWAYEKAVKAGNKVAWPLFSNLRYAINLQDKGRLNNEAFGNYIMAIEKEVLDHDFWGAKGYLIRAAELGYLPAMYELGTCYLQGDVYQESAEEQQRLALLWLKKSAEGGYEPSMNNYGVLLEKEGNPETAFRYYLKAAEANYPPCVQNVALCYEAGTGVERNMRKADKFIKLSHELAYTDTEEMLGMLQNHKEERRADLFHAISVFEQTIGFLARVEDVVLTHTNNSYLLNKFANYNSPVQNNVYVVNAENADNGNTANPPAQQGREFVYQTTVNCYNSRGECDKLHIYKSKYTSLYRGSFLKEAELDKDATYLIRLEGMTIGGVLYPKCITPLGYAWYFNF